MRHWNQTLQTMILSSTLVSANGYAFSPNGNEGKESFSICNTCHNPTLTTPLAPPMWGVQRRYKRMSNDKDHFIELITQFAIAPTLEKAIFKGAVNKMGLMPKVALPESDLKKIAAYIWEEEFPPPCAHWEIGAENAKKDGDAAHEEKDRRMLNRFCK